MIYQFLYYLGGLRVLNLDDLRSRVFPRTEPTT